MSNSFYKNFMKNSKSGGSDDDYDTSSSSRRGGGFYESFLKDAKVARKKREKESEERAALEALKNDPAEQDKVRKEEHSKESVATRGGNVLKGVGRLAKSIVTEPIKAGKDAYEGIGDVARGQLGGREMERKTKIAMERNKEWREKFGSASDEQWKDTKFVEEAKKFTAETKMLTEVSQRSRDDMEKEQEVSAKKLAANAGETALNIGTLGGLTLGKQVAKKVGQEASEQLFKTALRAGGPKAVENIIKQGGKNLIKEGAEEVAKKQVKSSLLSRSAALGLEGSGYGITQTMKNNPDATAGDYLKGAAFGGVTGAAFPVAGAVLKSAPVKALDNAVSSGVSKATGTVADTAIGKKVGSVTEKISARLMDSLTPVIRDFKKIKDKNVSRETIEELRMLSGNVTNASAIAQGQRVENKAFQELGSLLAPDKTLPGSRRVARKEAKEIGEFISKKQEAINANKLGKEVEIPIGTQKQEQAYKLLNESTKDVLTYAHKNGLLNDATYAKYLADPDYTRVQKDVSDLLESNFKGTGGPEGSIKSTVFGQKLKGSKRDSVDPLVSFIEWHDKVVAQSERAKMSQFIIDKRNEHGLGKGYLRKADDVEARMAAQGEAAQLRVLRNGLEKVVKSESRYGRKLQQELDGLNKAGLNTALKKGGKDPLPEFSVEGLGGRVPTSKASMKVGPQDTKRFTNSLVDADVKDLEAIKRKIANREPKLTEALDNIIGLKREHEVVASTVRDLRDLAFAHRDARATGKTTIGTFRRGIKELYEDDPRIVEAISRSNRIEKNAIIRMLQQPSKLIQRTATAWNPAFGLANFVKDQTGSFIISKNARATHNPISFMMGLKEASLKPAAKAALRGVGARKTAEKVFNPSDEYAKFLKHVSGSTRVDIVRSMKSASRKTYEELGLKGDSIVRKLENMNSATENATRFQNFYGIYKNNLKKGADPDTALKKAIQVGRENSVDFSQSGDWAPFLKIFNPFANANTQGSRSLARALKERPVGTSMKIGATVLTPVAASTYYNLSDPNRALLYTSLPEHTRNNNLIFITSDGGVVKLPLPPGFKEFAQPVRNMIEAEYGMGDKNSFAETAKALFVDSINPASSGDMVPQAFRPIIEDKANHSFFTGDAIVPEYMQDRLPEDQVFSSTSQTYRDIAKKLGISPLRAKSLIQGYTSSVGEQAISYVDKARKTAGAVNDKGEPVATNDRDTLNQIKGRFTEDKPDTMKEASRRFYNAYKPLQSEKRRVSSEVNELILRDKRGEARRRVNEYNAKLNGKFAGISKYGWDEDWDDMARGLRLSSSDSAFDVREKNNR